MIDPELAPSVPSRLKNVHLTVRSVDESIGFYEAVFGASPEIVDGDRWGQFRVGGLAVAIAGPEESAANASGWIPTFEVSDLAEACRRVVDLGGASFPIRDMGSHGRTAVTTDPAGNHLVLWSASEA